MTKQKGFENQLQKLLRLLNKLNVELITNGDWDNIELRIDADGSGELVYLNHTLDKSLYGFKSTDELFQYLEAAPLERLQLTGDWQK